MKNFRKNELTDSQLRKTVGGGYYWRITFYKCNGAWKAVCRKIITCCTKKVQPNQPIVVTK